VVRVVAFHRDGATSPATIYEAPSELRTTAKVFFTTFPIANPAVAFIAYSADGLELGRWQFPGDASRPRVVHP
jgi:hypothetical protein